MDKSNEQQIKDEVKKRYTKLVKENSSCCSSKYAARPADKIAQVIGYTEEELSSLPEDIVKTSFGCGNPLAFAEIKEGEVVLDIGSGSGMDAVLAAKRVGKKGKVIGLDMTPEMIERAKKNIKNAGVEEIVEFLLGEMENMPVDDKSVDWIISNCVINLSPNKSRVFEEAYRVLKPGGRLLVSDIVSSNLSQEMKDDIASWAGCVAGTLEESEYLDVMKKAGFEDVGVIEKADFTDFFLQMGSNKIQIDPSNPSKIYSIKVNGAKLSVGK